MSTEFRVFKGILAGTKQTVGLFFFLIVHGLSFSFNHIMQGEHGERGDVGRKGEKGEIGEPGSPGKQARHDFSKTH